MSGFDVDAFLEGLEQDKASKGGPSDRVSKVLMNTRDNQGTIIFVPFMNKKNNNFYMTVERVREWKGHTTLLDSGEAWYRILPEDYYEDLTQENKDLLAEVTGLFDEIGTWEVHDWGKQRIRNYSLLYGVLISHSSTEGKEHNDNVDSPCLFIFPSLSPINALSTAIASKVQALKGNKSWITGILNPNNTGREGVVSLTYKKESGPGYSTTISFEFNTQYNVLVDPEHEFEEEVTKLFDDPLRDLMGWQGGEGNNYFNEVAMKELRNDLRLELNSLIKESEASKESETKYENKNSSSDRDPMKSPTSTGDVPKNDNLPF